ncbi:MAG: DNA-3-methyladenine glycosylase [Candidatus Sungbacteria bacterium]|nr:DNA-3-methyladenine glycosylase [Candidatus Sungbacteria bacterium]
MGRIPPQRNILAEVFFARSPLVVARELLGKFLVRKLNGKELAEMITETEAYWGRGDMSSHARVGPTKRNRAMFGPPGRWYVYFTYGMHHCMNIVTGVEGEASAVLIRSVRGIAGPARICKALGIDLAHCGKLAAKPHGLWVEDRGVNFRKLGYRIERTPRINVSGDKKARTSLWRFVLTISNY